METKMRVERLPPCSSSANSPDTIFNASLVQCMEERKTHPQTSSVSGRGTQGPYCLHGHDHDLPIRRKEPRRRQPPVVFCILFGVRVEVDIPELNRRPEYVN